MQEQLNDKISKRTIITIVLILIAILSIFVIAKVVGSHAFNASMIESLDEKKETVLKVSLSAAAASTALTLIPGDTAMPIANEIAQLTTYFIVILGAILLEKMLITVIGHVTFTYIIPLACVLGIVYLYTNQEVIRNLAIKLAIFGVVITLAIPTSIGASEMIYASYEDSVNQTIETAEANNAYIEEKKNELAEEDQNWFDKIGTYLNDLSTKVGANITDIIKKGEQTLSSFMDAIAVLIITTCIIPLIVILIFSWIIKILFGFDSGLSLRTFNVRRK